MSCRPGGASVRERLLSDHPETGELTLAVVVPTYNEADNVAALVAALKHALDGIDYEIVFVDDDSPDGTADVVRSIGRRDRRVRCLQRLGRRGLSGACIEGILATAAPYAAVIDGDLQHDETVLPQMLDRLQRGACDVAVGSRYLGGEHFGDWDKGRVRASKLATRLAKTVTGVRITDLMSGFFMVRTELFRAIAPNMSGIGFKVLLDLLASARQPLQVAEIAYQFRSRAAGESTLDAKVVLEYVELLIDKSIGRLVPAKFVMFGLVGALGVVVHMGVLTALFRGSGIEFGAAQIAASLTAMTTNFALNNVFTHHDRRLSGWRWLTGLASFAAASSVGLIANVGIATYLFATHDAAWYLSALAGIAVGAVWNYAVTSFFTWKRR